MYYIIDCIQGNSKVGDYIIQICYVASMYVGSIALLHRRLKAITICLDYLHQVIILLSLIHIQMCIRDRYDDSNHEKFLKGTRKIYIDFTF